MDINDFWSNLKNMKMNSYLSNNDEKVSEELKKDYTRFSGKIKTGANYSFTQQTYVQVTYGFNYVDSGIENLSSDFTAHSFNAKLVINF